MRKRLLLASGTMAGLVGVAVVVVAMLPPGPGVTKANFDRVETGMNLEAAERILGKAGEAMMYRADFPMVWMRWEGDDGSVATFGLLNGHISRKGVYTPSEEDVLKKLRRWLRLAPQNELLPPAHPPFPD